MQVGMQHAGKIIGQGSYGCVTSPALPSTTPLPNNGNGYVSKFMKKSEAQDELHEFELIDTLDPTNRYHLGTPILYVPVLNEASLREVKGCRHAPSQKNFHHYRALLLKYGGVDIDKFCEKITNKTKVGQFWKAMGVALEGMVFFEKHYICHHDIKPSNLVYSPETNKMAFIDFGLMTQFQKMSQRAKHSELTGRVHWSYPLEYMFLNYDSYQQFMRLSSTQSREWENMFIEEFFQNKEDVFSSFDTTFYYFYSGGITTSIGRSIKEAHLRECFKGMRQYKNYEVFLRRTIQSIDCYAMGMTLQYALNQFFKKRLISQEIWKMGTALFREQMGNWNPQKRLLNFSTILASYRPFLELVESTTPLRPVFRGGRTHTRTRTRTRTNHHYTRANHANHLIFKKQSKIVYDDISPNIQDNIQKIIYNIHDKVGKNPSPR